MQGKVISDKMEKTVVVEVERTFLHPRYKKPLTKGTRLKAHDERGAKVGDTVVLAPTRPLSKEKRWKVIEVIR